jgi:hypothetical protein
MRLEVASLILIEIIFLQSLALALSVEITTGSGGNEGIKGASGKWLRDGSLVQVIKTFDGVKQPPSEDGKAAFPDELIATSEIGYNFPFSRDQGKIDLQIWINKGERIYVRAWDGRSRYGDSEVHTVKGIDGEVWNIGGKVNKPAFQVSKDASKAK